MGKRRTIRTGRQKMYGGVEGDEQGSTSNSLTEGAGNTIENVGSKAVTAVTPIQNTNSSGYFSSWFPTRSSTDPSGNSSWFRFPTWSSTTGGRRRRHRRTKMRGGDFSPNSAFTNAMEVQNIQMASPQTLVGGRRRRKSSRKSRRSRSSRRR